MCIIIDANVAGELPGPSADAKPVVDWIEGGSGRLVIGGRNTIELDAHRGVRRWLIRLLQSGRARAVSAEMVRAKERELLRQAGTVPTICICLLWRWRPALDCCSHVTAIFIMTSGTRNWFADRGARCTNAMTTPRCFDRQCAVDSGSPLKRRSVQTDSTVMPGLVSVS